MMIECVERRFQAPRSPHRFQGPTDNGSIMPVAKTIDIALARGLDPASLSPLVTFKSKVKTRARLRFKRVVVRVENVLVIPQR
jgi:hypothetical protein